MVGDHYSGRSGWILLHNSATYPTQAGGDAHPCPVSGHTTTSQGGLTEIWACDEIGIAPYIDVACAEFWCPTCSGPCSSGCWPGCENEPSCANYKSCKETMEKEKGDSVCTSCPAGYIQPNAGPVWSAAIEDKAHKGAAMSSYLSEAEARAACVSKPECTMVTHKFAGGGTGGGVTGTYYIASGHPVTNVGTYINWRTWTIARSETCMACPGGWHSITPGGTSCTSCDIGKARSLTAPATVACTNCLPGFAMDSTGAFACYECERGSYSVGGTSSAACVVCEAGKYQERNGRTSCGICDPGRYIDHRHNPMSTIETVQQASLKHDNWGDCLRCDLSIGLKINEDRSKCEYCPVGEYGLTLDANGLQLDSVICTECALCPAGQSMFEDEDISSCRAIQPGSCRTCPIGWYKEKGTGVQGEGAKGEGGGKF